MNSFKERPSYLREAIESYLNQAAVDVQLILSMVEGDDNIKIAEEYGVDLVLNDAGNIYEQLNAALPVMTGDFFCYAASNDVAEPFKLSMESDTLLAFDADVCYADFKTINADGQVVGRRSFYDYDYQKHLNGNFVSDCAMVRMSKARECLPFKLVWGNHAYWDFWIRMYDKGAKFHHLAFATWRYRLTDDSQHIIRAKNPDKVRANSDLRAKMIKSHKNK